MAPTLIKDFRVPGNGEVEMEVKLEVKMEVEMDALILPSAYTWARSIPGDMTRKIDFQPS